MNQPSMGNVPNAIRPPQRHPMPGKNMGMPPPPQAQHAKPTVQPFPGTAAAKRDIVFPSKFFINLGSLDYTNCQIFFFLSF